MAMLLRDLGVPERAMLLESRSLNTRQNARDTAQLLARRAIQQMLLVTSALHMRHSLAQMRRHGLQAVPAATDFEGKRQAGIPQWLLSVRS